MSVHRLRQSEPNVRKLILGSCTCGFWKELVFQEEIERRFRRHADPGRRFSKPEPLSRATTKAIWLIWDIFAKGSGLTGRQLARTKRNEVLTPYRYVAMALCDTLPSTSQKHIAALLEADPSLIGVASREAARYVWGSAELRVMVARAIANIPGLIPPSSWPACRLDEKVLRLGQRAWSVYRQMARVLKVSLDDLMPKRGRRYGNEWGAVRRMTLALAVAAEDALHGSTKQERLCAELGIARATLFRALPAVAEILRARQDLHPHIREVIHLCDIEVPEEWKELLR